MTAFQEQIQLISDHFITDDYFTFNEALVEAEQIIDRHIETSRDAVSGDETNPNLAEDLFWAYKEIYNAGLGIGKIVKDFEETQAEIFAMIAGHLDEQTAYRVVMWNLKPQESHYDIEPPGP